MSVNSKKRSKYLQRIPHAIATTSCTTALHIAVAALGLEPSDEVIVPAFTWISTANVVEFMGATPIFCDIDLRTFNIDVEQISSLITERTVGIIPVHHANQLPLVREVMITTSSDECDRAVALVCLWQYYLFFQLAMVASSHFCGSIHLILKQIWF